jgi:predicted amidohydrolase YtcJ
MRTTGVALLTLLLLSCGTASTAPVDLLLVNGRVFTGDTSRPWAESVAITGSRIVAVGTNAELAPLRGKAGRVIDAGGKLVVPGINDAHVHKPSESAPDNVDVTPASTVDELLRAVRDAAVKAPAGTWLRGTMPVPLIGDARLTRDVLDRVAPQHPVIFEIVSGHAALLNGRAMKEWSIEESDPDPAGGWYERAEGRLTGWIYEHALWSKQQRERDALSDAKLIERMDRFADEAVRFGITSVQSMPLMPVERLNPLLSRTQVPLRWRLMQLHMARVDESPRTASKYILDGTPMERGAAMRADYSDRPAHRGRANYSDEQFAAMVRTAAKNDQQLLLHISGDRMLEKLFAEMEKHPGDWRAKRLRIEHGDFIGEFLPEAKRAGVVLVQNPTHFLFPELMARRFGHERTRRFAALRSALRAGIPIALGSDGPLNPWLNLMIATTHPRNPDEALTRDEALRAYTSGSAYAEHMEHEKGTIAPGKLADIAVLSQDIFTVPTESLPATKAVLTIIGGEVVYDVSA